VPPGFALAGPLVHAALRNLANPGRGLGTPAIRFALALLILGPPATLVGATLPPHEPTRLRPCGLVALLQPALCDQHTRGSGWRRSDRVRPCSITSDYGRRSVLAASVNLFIAFVAICAGQAIQADSKEGESAPADGGRTKRSAAGAVVAAGTDRADGLIGTSKLCVASVSWVS